MEFRILGPLEVWDGDRPVAVTGARQRALLAVLLLHANHVVPSDRLIDELWGEEGPESGAAALRVRVSQLRKSLRKDVVQTKASGYVVRAERNQLDLHRFERLVREGRELLESRNPREASERLRRALELWRGPALADFAYERFAQPAIARLEELRLAALELRVDADLALGRHDELVGELENLVAEHPLRERVRGQLMLALYRSGRQAEALATYREGRSVLVDQLGIEPGPALHELEQAILRHDPALDLDHQTVAGAEQPPAATRSLLVAVLVESLLDGLLAIAAPLARRPSRELILVRLLVDGAELEAATARLQQRRAELEGEGVLARTAVFTSSGVGEDLVRLAAEQEVDLLLLDAPRGLIDDGRPDADLSAVLETAPCDVALLTGAARSPEGPVLVPFGGFEHDWAAVELGAWVARAHGTRLRLLGAEAVPEAGKRDASRLLSHAALAVHRGLGVAAEPLLVAPGDKGILEASEDAGLLVIGLSTRWHREGIGSTRLVLATEAKCPLLLVKRGLRPGGLAPRASLTRFTWSIRAGA